jgi:hypothetical protein
MKKLSFVGHFDIDFEKERQTIMETLNGEQRDRQMELIDLFEHGKLEEWITAYNELPYCIKEGCSEQEFVGVEFIRVISNLNHPSFKLDKYEIVS